MLHEILAWFFLLGFLLINVMIIFIRLFGSIAGMTWRKLLRLEISENEKKDLEKFYTIVWIAVGTWAFWQLKNASWIAAIFGFIAFRSGANITRTLVYGLHDTRLIEQYTDDSRVLALVGKATQLSILTETIFVVAFALVYKTLSVTLNSNGMSANSFIILLWLGGLAFGVLFGRLITRNNQGILLRNAMITVGFFTGRAGRQKVKKVGETARSKLPGKELLKEGRFSRR
ncbi:hypothetical protein [Thermococcus sp. GR6]|uniref:hypothetical protein n=1 Tax=Thermococcus sp. GR6 TaxID=1638256 RepID=UPI001431ED50|nr:hypothetical protein [Thermococcus sp. GR6]